MVLTANGSDGRMWCLRATDQRTALSYPSHKYKTVWSHLHSALCACSLSSVAHFMHCTADTSLFANSHSAVNNQASVYD